MKVFRAIRVIVCLGLLLGAACAADRDVQEALSRKLDSHLLLALKKQRGEPPFDKPTRLDPDVVIEGDGRVLVDLKTAVTQDLLACLGKANGTVISSVEAAHAVRALLPLNRLEEIAMRADVQFVAPAVQGITNEAGAAQGSTVKP